MHTSQRSRPPWTGYADDGSLRDRVTVLEVGQESHDGRIGKLEGRMKLAADWIRYAAGAGLLYLVGAGRMTIDQIVALIKALADLLRALGGK